jgi:hypothetical protein
MFHVRRFTTCALPRLRSTKQADGSYVHYHTASWVVDGWPWAAARFTCLNMSPWNLGKRLLKIDWSVCRVLLWDHGVAAQLGQQPHEYPPHCPLITSHSHSNIQQSSGI